MNQRFEWKITKISDMITVGKEKTINKKIVALEEITDAQYPASMAFDFTNDKISMLDWFKVWDQVEISFNTSVNISNKDWKESIFNSIRWWRIQYINQAPVSNNNDESLPF